MLTLAATGFGALDWAIVIVYLLIVVAIGILASLGRRGEGEFFLAGRSMPMWAVAVSVLATSQSAATFVGGPQQSYAGDLTYLAANLGVLIASVLVAIIFIPAYYRASVTSVYELIGNEYGSVAQRAASGMFMLGRIFASGARLFIVAIPFALIAFGDIKPASLILAIILIALVATAYTMVGGIRAVIWTDVLQAVIYIAAITIALLLLWNKIPADIPAVIDALQPEGDRSKLTLIDTGLDAAGLGDFLARPYTLPAIILGMTLFNMAAFGTDQDLTQRMLTCRSARAGSWSVIAANIAGLPIVFLFLLMGLLLYVYYNQSELIGLAQTPAAPSDDRKVFLTFILDEMPTGLRGLMLAGLFAAAMSSLDSVLNALASTTIADFIRPARTLSPDSQPASNQRVLSRILVAGWAIVLAGFAIICVFWQRNSGDTLIDFALGVMVFAYSGLLAVFGAATLTRRGNARSVLAALATGFILVTLMQPGIWERWTEPLGVDFTLAFPWRMLLATLPAFGVCCLGKRA